MTWPVIARSELRVLRKDNTLTIFIVLFALIAIVMSYVTTGGEGAPPLVNLLSLLFMFAVPLTAGSLVHEAIPSTVKSGRIRLTLSLPHTRTEFLAGVGVSRIAALVASVCAALLAGIIVYLFRGGPLSPIDIAASLTLSALLGGAFVGATLAFTARSQSTSFSAMTTFGFFLLALAWPVAVALGEIVLAAQFNILIEPVIADTLIQLSPIYAYQNALSSAGIASSAPVGLIPEWGGVVVLLAWAVGGFFLATRRFDSRDL